MRGARELSVRIACDLFSAHEHPHPPRPGSGCVTAFVGAILGATTCAYLTLDINEHATIATEATGKQNGVSISAVGSNMLSAIEQRARGHIDLLIFNPPYVPTTEEEEKQAQAWAEADGGQLSASWAGGSMGTRLLDMLIHGNGFCATPLHEVLAVGGKFYLVAIRQNKPESIVETLKGKGLQAEVSSGSFADGPNAPD